MAKIGLIRCARNAGRCPITGCLTCMQETRQSFQGYDRAELVGIFTCECPGDHVADYAKILANKGADAIHLTTCTFAHKEEDKWVMGSGLCAQPDTIMEKMAAAVNIPCLKGSAHLPEGYQPEVFGSEKQGA
jgi:predicted metal-binding protein